jgi:hypothetical protein
MLDQLFERAQHIPLWILSLGNAVVGLDDLEGKMKRLGRETRALEIHHQHLAAVATREKKQQNREFLVVGVDLEGIDQLLRSKSVDHATRVHLNHLPGALVHEDPDPLGSQRPAAQTLASDGLQESHPTLSDQSTSHRRHPVSVADGDGDDPSAVGSKSSGAIDSERRLA